MTTCEYSADDVVRYHTGDMPFDEAAAFSAHLARCGKCSGRVQAQAELDRRVARLPEYRAPRMDRMHARPGTRQRLLVAASLTALLLAGVLADRLRRDVREDRMVRAALAADARMLAFLPGRAPPPGDDPLPPWLGFVTCDDWIASDPEGVYICALAADGPLGLAGVEAGDVLLAVGRHAVPVDTAMYRRLARHGVGDVVEVSVRRQDGTVDRLRVRLEARRIGERHPFDMEWSPALLASLDRIAPGAVDLHDVFRPDTVPGYGPALRVLMEPTPEQTRRTVIAAVPHLFGADRLRAGDVILRLEERPIAGLWDLLPGFMDVQRRTAFTLHVLRDGEPVAVVITNPRGTEP